MFPVIGVAVKQDPGAGLVFGQPPRARVSWLHLLASCICNQIGGQVCAQRNQGEEHGEIHQQGQIAAERRLPRQLPDSRRVAQGLEGDAHGQGGADRDPSQGEDLRRGKPS